MEINSLISLINNDAKTWNFFGHIKEKQKIEIDVDKQGIAHLQVSRGKAGDVLQAIIRTVKQIFGTIASAEPTVHWISSQQLRTNRLLENLSQVIQQPEVDARTLESALEALRNLKYEIANVNNGLENLKETYQNRKTEKGEFIPELLTNEQEKIKAKQKKITDLILISGEKLQVLQGSGMDTSKAVASVANPEERVKSYYTQPKESVKGQEVARELVQGKGNAIKPTTLAFKGKSAVMPEQFSLDLPRMISLKLNGEEIYSRYDPERRDPVDAYERICQAFEEKEAQTIARNLCAMVLQSNTADLAKEVFLMANNDPNNLVVPKGGDVLYSVEVKGGKVKITIKLSFDLVTPRTRMSSSDVKHGAIIAKREIEIPIEDLRVENIASISNPLPGVKVTDTYSKQLRSAEYAEELLPFF